MRKTCLPLLLLAVLSVGCLEKETTQTIFIEDDGSVTWEVDESDVYSSSETLEDRSREEAEYLAMAQAGQPHIARALAEIGGAAGQTHLRRDRRPFHLRATARFRDPEPALGGLFSAVEVDAEVTLEREGGRHVLTITPTDLESGLDGDDNEGPVLELMRSEGIRLVLSSGTFESVEGFCLQSGGRVAVLDGDCEPEPAAEERFRLAWDQVR